MKPTNKLRETRENVELMPVGIEFFDEIRTSGYYYIDKTKLIEQLLQNMGKVSLFTPVSYTHLTLPTIA